MNAAYDVFAGGLREQYQKKITVTAATNSLSANGNTTSLGSATTTAGNFAS